MTFVHGSHRTTARGGSTVKLGNPVVVRRVRSVSPTQPVDLRKRNAQAQQERKQVQRGSLGRKVKSNEKERTKEKGMLASTRW
tara:strand:- start:200 stop:448 length:249 start_codon:yes stop_codon:yes gene_type:complete